MLLEIIQGMGSAAGLLSAGYLGWQFATRRTPVAIIVPLRPWEISPTASQFVRIKNPSDRPMIVRFDDNVDRNELRIVRDDSIRAAVEAAVGRSVEVIISANETRDFRLARRADHEEIEPENYLQVRFRWRYAQPFLLRVERTAVVIIRKSDYDALATDDRSGNGA